MSRRPDVLVIGAGLVGAACAWHLAAQGLRVEVVEAGGIGGGATAEGMGHLVVMDDSPNLLALTAWSLELWRDLAPELPEACEMSTCGTLWLAQDEADLATLASKASRLAARGVAHEILDGDALRRLEPNLAPSLPGALRVPMDAVVYAPRVAAFLLAHGAATAGLRCRTGVAVEALQGGQEDEDAIARLSDGRRVTAGRVVLATGHRALELLSEPVPGLRLAPRKGHLLITERHPGFCRHQLVEVGYAKSAQGNADDSVAFNLQARPNGQLLLGSSRQFGITDRAVDPQIVRRMLRRAVGFVPGIGRLSALRAWTGFRAATPDHLPLLGPVPGRPRWLLASGHEGLGITTALAGAHLLADHILRRPSPIPAEPYRLERCLEPAA